MGLNRDTSGFTVIELVVTLAVMSVFLLLFIQTFVAGETQRGEVAKRSAAADIAAANLNKISSKAALLDRVPTLFSASKCNSNSNVEANANNVELSSSAGAIIATDRSGVSPTWATAGLTKETTLRGLPATTTQEIRVLFPRGCDPDSPVTVVSIVTYGSEEVRRATLVN